MRPIVVMIFILVACSDLRQASESVAPVSPLPNRSPSVVVTASLEVSKSPAPTLLLPHVSIAPTPTSTPSPKPTATLSPTPVLGRVAQPKAKPPTEFEIDVELVSEGFDRPVFVGHAGDGSRRLFVAEKRGVIRPVIGGAILGHCGSGGIIW